MKKFVIYERRGDRDYDDVQKVGEAANEEFAKMILHDYAKRCSYPDWNKDGRGFHAVVGVGYGENYYTVFNDVWAKEEDC